MFKVAYISSVDGLKEARGLLKQIYDENPKHWPAGLTPEHFDGGLYLIREASTGKAVGFCGWQERDEVKALKQGQLKESGSRLGPAWDNMFRSLGCRHTKVGYYSIGILPQFRQNGFAKEALRKLINAKSAGVDQVKALIMASNSPSLALADSLGVEKVVKQASAGALRNIWGNIARQFRSPVSGGILGPEIAGAARQKGVQMFMPKDWFTSNPNEFFNLLGTKRNVHKVLGDAAARLGISPKFVFKGQTPRAGVLLSPTGAKIPAAMRKGVEHAEDVRAFPHMMAGDVDKLREAQMLTGFIPPTESLGKFLRGQKRWSGSRIEDFRRRVSESVGPQWILKPRGGAASLPGSMVTEETALTPEIMRRLAAEPHLAQQRHVLEQVGPIQGLIDAGLGKVHKGFLGNLNRGSREYRVHTMGGRVVPYATSPRGSASEYLGYYLNPMRSKRTRQIEEYVQEALNRMPENVRRMGYGFDVGLDRFGRPFLIEANPAASGAASGFVSLPWVSDAYSAAVKGQLPNYVKLRNAAYAAGLGGAGYAYANRPEKPRTQRVWEALTQ